jgi:PAS domain S-box-containing protein
MSSLVNTAIKHFSLSSLPLKRLGIFFLVDLFAHVTGRVFLISFVDHVPIFWPGLGVYLGFLLTGTRNDWISLSLVVLLVRLIGHFFVPFTHPLMYQLAVWASSTLTYAGGAALLKKSLRKTEIDSVRFWLLVLVGGGVAIPLVASVMSTALTAHWRDVPFSFATWRYHLAGRSLGIWIATPTVLLLSNLPKSELKRMLLRDRLHDLCSMMATVAAGIVIFASVILPLELRLPVTLMPLLLWVALRGNLILTTATNSTIALTAIIVTSEGLGPFAQFFPKALPLLTALQMYVGIIILTSILISALVCARSKALAAVKSKSEQLALLNSELIHANESFDQLIEQASDGIFIMDASFNIKKVNAAACKMMRYSRAELTSMHMDQIVLPDLNPEITRRDQTALVNGGAILSELWHRRADGSVFLAEVSATQISDGRIQAIVRDITHRKELEGKLRNANKELEMFASMASHDLQEPLRTMGSYLQLILKRHQGKLGGDSEEFFHFVVDASVRMKALINELLSYARAGKRGIPPTPIDCNRLAERAVADIKVLIDEKRADVKFSELPCLMGRESEIQQLLQNLICNGIRYNRNAAPSIHVSCRRIEEGWEFLVRDNGIGIDVKDQNRIFEAFQRVAGRSDFPGTGLGLAVCKKIVEGHGGQLWVESTLGKGSTFHFTLPATQNCEQLVSA